MNLLPSKIKHRRQIQAECKRLTAVQAVIFLLFVLSVAGLDFIITYREDLFYATGLQMQDERFIRSEAVARVIQDRNLRISEQQAVADWLGLPAFDIARLNMLKETMPTGITMIHADIDEHGAQLTFYTKNLSLADIHRVAWMATGLVDRVSLASTVVTDGGGVQYVLALWWVYE